MKFTSDEANFTIIFFFFFLYPLFSFWFRAVDIELTYVSF